MRRDLCRVFGSALSGAALTFVWALGADAHGIAGNRFFPGTMAFDDPAVADEFQIQQWGLQQPLTTGTGINVLNNATEWSFVRLLTPDLALGVNSGWLQRSGASAPAQNGFDQTSLTLKRRMYENDLHEILVSVSLTWGIGNSGAKNVGANAPNTLSPSVTFGKGLGDLPDNLAWLRPFGITGAITAEFPTSASSTSFGVDATTGQFGMATTANVPALHWGFAVEYSTLYLTDRFTPGQLPKQEPLHQWVPLVEFEFDSPDNRKTAATMNPGVAYVADVWQVSVEAIVPLNSASGRGLGARGGLLLFLDDLLPRVFGKPLLGR